MTPPPLSPAWFSQFTDPYAVLGVSVTADDRRILKRYHQVAKRLHPDVQNAPSAEADAFANQALPKLVNPAYQRLKQEKQRSEILAMLRFKVRRLAREGKFQPQCKESQHLQTVPEAEVDTVYEHTLQLLSTTQYDSAEDFTACTHRISELNLVYFQRKIGETIIREKRVGVMKSPIAGRTVTSSDGGASQATMGQGSVVDSAPAYADRHYQRAREYLQGKNAPAAIQELRDALKLEPKNSNFHSLMGQAYLLNKLPGMAKVHFKQALRIDPNNVVAQKYARQLKIDIEPTAPTQSAPPSTTAPAKSFLGRLFSNAPK